MADLGQIGLLIEGVTDAQYPYSITGTVTDNAGAPKLTCVAFIAPGDNLTVPPSIDKVRFTNSSGVYAAPFATKTPVTVLCCDTADTHANDIVFGKVVPG